MQTAKYVSLLLLFVGLGCGPAPSTSSQSDRHDPIGLPMPAPTEVQINAAKGGHLTCEFTGECEPALAMVSIATGTGVSRCTGFLISDHELLSNDHCFETVADRETACQGIVFAHFTGDVHRECKRITVRSHQTGIDTKDYAVVELDSAVKDRSPLRLSRHGFGNHEAATVYTIQAGHHSQTDSYDGKQLKLNCQASYATIMDTNIHSAKESLMTFGDCTIHEGNSGSPIMNENGEVGAIAQGFLTVKGDRFADQLKPWLLDGSYGEVAIATQARCIPELVGNVANGCETVKPLTALYPDDYMRAFGGFSENLLPSLSFGVLWKEWGVPGAGEKQFISVPKCIAAFEASSGNLSFTSSVMLFQQGINSRLEAEWRTEEAKETLFVIQKTAIASPSTVDFVSKDLGLLTLSVCGR